MKKNFKIVSRRNFLIASASGLAGIGVPSLSRTAPCPPPLLQTSDSFITATECGIKVPSYISSLSAFQVRAMTGAFSPSNGKETLHSVTPVAWGNEDDILRPWSGGPKVLNGEKLWVHGGGHTDSRNNGLYSFDFTGDQRPSGWNLPCISASPTLAIADSGTGYSDGLPSSTHTYDGMCELNGNFYRRGGSLWGTGSSSNNNDFWKFNPIQNKWTLLQPRSGAGSLIADTEGTGKILYLDRLGTYNGYSFYNTNTGIWSSVKYTTSPMQQWPDNGCLAYRPDSIKSLTGTGIITGASTYGNKKSFTFRINWATETLDSFAERDFGELTTLSGSACFYDSMADRFWGFGGGNVNIISTIYEINPSNWSIIPHQLSGDNFVNNETDYYVGLFGRFVFMPRYRAIGTVLSRSGPAYVIKLP